MAKRIKEYPIHKIKHRDPMNVSLKKYISEIFKEYGEDFAQMFFENRLNNETKTTIVVNLSDKGNWNKKKLTISLEDVE